eukprot:TRINITY_DN50776_c0_g1_i1.p1 TRINITY_DN50776_c0_g1~~TRINITY_DN50776_c0_g1_i1.p1  ORF type:complete len:549 (+),score=253.62 TRINITY_DN50776_c0_g1_i1:104-1648(+)
MPTVSEDQAVLDEIRETLRGMQAAAAARADSGAGADSAAREATLSSLQDECKAREREFFTVVKMLRERTMIIQMKELRESQVRAEVDRQIAAATEAKDQQIHAMVTQQLSERQSILADIEEHDQLCKDAQEKLATAHYEDPEEKKRNATKMYEAHRAGVWADWENPRRSPSGKHPALEKMTRHKASNQAFGPVRSEVQRGEQHDRGLQFEKARADRLGRYDGTRQELDKKKQTLREGKQTVAVEKRKTRELELLIAKEKKEKEREIANLKQRLHLAQEKQARLKEENARISAAQKGSQDGLRSMEQKLVQMRSRSPPPAQIEARPRLTRERWAEISHKLPFGSDPESRARRHKLWSDFDVNGNGMLSLAEVDKAIRDMLQIDELFHAKPAIMKAFNAARKKYRSKRPDPSGHMDDYIQKPEFRYLLWYLREYFELWCMFEEVAGDDHRIQYQEFEAALPRVHEWGVDIEDPQAAFQELDSDGGGMILFGEFANWALQKGLDLQEDDDPEDHPDA